MTYDPQKRPNFLGFEHDRTNPNRLSVGVLSVADDKENQIPVVEKPPTLIEKLMSGGKVVALILVGLASTVIALQAQGVVLPAWLATLATTILALGVPLGIVSSGVKKKEPADPDSLK